MVSTNKNEQTAKYLEYCKRRMPHLRKNILPTEAQLKKHPGLVYIIQFGDGKKTMVFGPKETYEEKKRKKLQQQEQEEHNEHMKTTEDQIFLGKQKTLTAFFRPKANCQRKSWYARSL